MHNQSRDLLGGRTWWGDAIADEHGIASGDLLLRAANGDCVAQFELGEWLCKTFGLADAAFPWYLKSARSGFAAAAQQVAYMFLAGKGIEEDPAQAMHWGLVAIAKGERDSVNIVKAARTVLTQEEINDILHRFRERLFMA